MDIEIYQSDGKMLVRLTGRVVLDECDRLKGVIVSRIAAGIRQVNLDLSNVDFIDSAGLGVLVAMKVSSNKNRANLALISPSKGVNDILMVSKLDSIFDIVTGAEAKQIIDQLAKPQNLVGSPEPESVPQPEVPAFQAPPGGEAEAQSAKARIDKLCNEAIAHMRQRDYERAIACYKKVLEIEPAHLPAHNNLAIVYEKMPQWQDLAIAQWERVLELSQEREDQKHIERAQKHLAAIQRL